MAKELRLEGIQDAFNIMDGLTAKAKGKTLQKLHRIVVKKTLMPRKPTVDGVDEFIKIATDRNDATAIQFGIESRAFWFRFIEYGTKLRTRKSGGSTGTMPAKPFWNKFIKHQLKTVVRAGNKAYSDFVAGEVKKKIRRIA